VRTHDELDCADGLLVAPSHIAVRRGGATGTITGVVTPHGGDVYWVHHPGDKVFAAYDYTEFELLEDPGGHGMTAERTAA
jgi:hypothetical protein